MFFGQKMLFLAENLSNPVRYGGGGYPPIPLIFFVVKNRPLKINFFGQKRLFLAENFSNPVRYGGGVPFHYFFPVSF